MQWCGRFPGQTITSRVLIPTTAWLPLLLPLLLTAAGVGHAVPTAGCRCFPVKTTHYPWLGCLCRSVQVWDALSPRLAGEEEELAWLREATAPL